ncbi:MAG: acyl-CoA thioesterase [Lysobacterales bacterium]
MSPTRLLFSCAISVRWGDLDAFNHVNNAVYSTYLEEARLCWLQGLDGAWSSGTAAPVVANMQIDFRRPINWPATVSVGLYVGRVGRSSLVLPFTLRDTDDPELLYAEGETTMVWIDPQSGRAVPLPEAIRRAATRTECE